MAEQAITTLDAFEAAYREGVGRVLPRRGGKEASLDNIRRFGDGVGDYNPLWRDDVYAARSGFAGVTAPPIFVYGASLGVSAAIYGAISPARLSSANFPMNYAGGEIEFLRTIWLGDTISAEEEVGPILRKSSSRIGDFCICTGLVRYWNQRRELVATKKTLMARYQNLGGDRTIEYDRSQKRQVQGDSPDALVWERKRRGAEVRYWDDVREGEEIPSLAKGEYTVTELFLFTHGVVGTGRSPRAALDAEGSRDLGGGGRFDAEHARKRRNMPGQFDWGPQRVCWLSQIVTDWMGDAGILKKMVSQVRHPNIVGDVNTLYGNVARKYQQDDLHLVDVDVRVENQAGLPTAMSRVALALPVRATSR